MATVRFRDFDQLVLPLVNGPSIPAVEDAVRSATIEWCQRTRVDTRILRGLTYSTAEPDFFIPAPDAHLIAASAISVWIADRDDAVPQVTRPEIDAQFPGGFVDETVDSVDDVYGWISLRPDRIRLIPAPESDLVGGLTIEVSFQPRRTALVCEAFLHDLYGEDIAHGAALRLHSHVGAPYADPQRVAYFEQRWIKAIGRAGDRYRGGHNKKALRGGGDMFV